MAGSTKSRDFPSMSIRTAASSERENTLLICPRPPTSRRIHLIKCPANHSRIIPLADDHKRLRTMQLPALRSSINALFRPSSQRVTPSLLTLTRRTLATNVDRPADAPEATDEEQDVLVRSQSRRCFRSSLMTCTVSEKAVEQFQERLYCRPGHERFVRMFASWSEPFLGLKRFGATSQVAAVPFTPFRL